ncbi:MAG: DUF523 domain-containing protein [Candidatus Eisenbacteria sp.]|nr:DUF523 domain-containing protein [Candidatus Eisenbacteria bacterium]
MILVSACLAGMACRYDGAADPDEDILKLVREGRAVPICPEQAGGLPTPRTPAEIVGGAGEDVLDGNARVVDEEGRDRTTEFLRGADEALALALRVGGTRAILRQHSPSCGYGWLRIRGKSAPGNGVTAACLLRAGIEVEARHPGKGETT